MIGVFIAMSSTIGLVFMVAFAAACTIAAALTRPGV